MTLREVAHYLHCYPITVYRLIQRSTIPVFRIGSDYRIWRADLEKWIAQRHVEPASAATGTEPKAAKSSTKRKLASTPKSRS